MIKIDFKKLKYKSSNETLGRKHRHKFSSPWIRQWFLSYNTKTTSKKSTLDFIKIKNICASKDTIKKMKKQHTEWERLFTSPISKRDLYLKYTKTHKTQQFKKKR